MSQVPNHLKSFIFGVSLLLSAGLVSVSAQEQEKTVQEKLFGKPDMSLEYVPRSFGGERVLKEFKVPDMRIRPFLFRERFAAKEFNTEVFKAKDYSTKNFLSGKDAYQTKDGLANWRSSAAPNSLTKDAGGLRNFETAQAGESNKSKSNDKSFETKGTVVPGKSQKELDETYHGKPALTIDQVRELLNKNK